MKNSYLNIITVVFLVTFVSLLVSIYLIRRTANALYRSYDWVEHTYNIINELEGLQKNLYKSSVDAGAYFMAHLPAHKNNFTIDTTTIKSDLAHLTLLNKNKEQSQNINKLKLFVDERINLSVQVWIGGTSKDVGVIKKTLERANQINIKMYNLINVMTDLEKKLLEERKVIVLKNLSRTMDYILFSALSIVVIGFLFIVMVRRDMERIRKHEARLVELNESKIKFFSIISHDLKGPAYAAQQLSDMISKEGEGMSQEEKKEVTGMMNESIKRVTALLEELLDWARVQMNRIEFSPKGINLKNISNGIIEKFRPILENKKITIYNLIEDNIEALADNYMTSTILRNLIGNAIKFSNVNKNIFISCNLHKQAGFVEVKIKDEGIGISPKIQEQLFNIGSRTSTKGTQEETGTGLGLILCKEFVEKQGGKIWVESKEGKGSTFIFTIPVADSKRNKRV